MKNEMKKMVEEAMQWEVKSHADFQKMLGVIDAIDAAIKIENDHSVRVELCRAANQLTAKLEG